MWFKDLLRGIVYLIIAFACYAAIAEATQDDKAVDQFITLADIHFNPFSGCEKLPIPCKLARDLKRANAESWQKILEQKGNPVPAGYYQETNYPLFKLTLAELNDLNQKIKPHFILVLGDFLAHRFRKQYIQYAADKTPAGYDAFVKKTLQFLTLQINKTFPDVDVYPALGNNDSYNGNYRVIPQGAFLQDTTNTWSVLIKNAANRQAFQAVFPKAGYYAITVPGQPSLRILILNTVLFSARNHSPAVQLAAQNELIWLRSQLRHASEAKQHVLIAYHIPYGIDIFSTFLKGFTAVQYFWQPAFSSEFEENLKAFAPSIVGILPAHLHRDKYEVEKFSGHIIPIHFTPSISPIFGNNPGIKVFTYDIKTFQLEKSSLFFYPVTDSFPVWEMQY